MPCKGGMKARNRCGRGQTKHRWDDVNDDDENKDRQQIAGDDAIDSQALTGGDIARYRALVARISYLSQDRPDLKFAWMRVCCAMAKPTMRDMECVKRIGRYLVGKPRAMCWFRWQQSGDLRAYSDADWGGDQVNRRGLGKAKHVDMPNLWIQEACKSNWFVTKKVDTSVNPADLMTKPMPKARTEQLMLVPRQAPITIQGY